MHQGRVVFGAMDEVVVGEPAAKAGVRQIERLRASRSFLMVSGTLKGETDEIEKVSRALGSRCPAIVDAMPQRTPREAVIAARANPARSEGRTRTFRCNPEGRDGHALDAAQCLQDRGPGRGEVCEFLELAA